MRTHGQRRARALFAALLPMAGGEPFPGGTFVAGGVQTVGIVGHNEWDESCWSFSYSNTTAPAAGLYTGTVLYTLTSP